MELTVLRLCRYRFDLEELEANGFVVAPAVALEIVAQLVDQRRATGAPFEREGILLHLLSRCTPNAICELRNCNLLALALCYSDLKRQHEGLFCAIKKHCNGELHWPSAMALYGSHALDSRCAGYPIFIGGEDVTANLCDLLAEAARERQYFGMDGLMDYARAVGSDFEWLRTWMASPGPYYSNLVNAVKYCDKGIIKREWRDDLINHPDPEVHKMREAILEASS